MNTFGIICLFILVSSGAYSIYSLVRETKKVGESDSVLYEQECRCGGGMYCTRIEVHGTKEYHTYRCMKCGNEITVCYRPCDIETGYPERKSHVNIDIK